MQVLQLSGIVALFFTGICHAHYSYFSVERDAQITLRRFFQFAAFISETFVFAFLGLQVLGCSTCIYMCDCRSKHCLLCLEFTQAPPQLTCGSHLSCHGCLSMRIC